MELVNQTSFPSDKLRQIITFCALAGVTDFIIRFKHWKHYSGAAYIRHTRPKPDGYRSRAYPDRGRTKRSSVVIRIKKKPRGAGQIENKMPKLKARGYLASAEYTQEEAIVHLVAHELRHLWQANVPKGQGIWGARGRFSERDADAYAIRKVRHWRRRGSPYYGQDGEILVAEAPPNAPINGSGTPI
jgi:hypothetical protein